MVYSSNQLKGVRNVGYFMSLGQTIQTDISSDAYRSSGSTQVLLQRTVTYFRSQLRDLPICSLTDNDISESSSSVSFIDDGVEWNSVMIKPHSTTNLNCTSSWLEYHNQFHGTC